jgi:hypothetical protein
LLHGQTSSGCPVLLLLLPQGEATLQFQAQQGALTLEQEINQIGPGHNFTKLVSH